MAGYPSPAPTTLLDLYGHPIVDEDASDWTNHIKYQRGCTDCPNRYRVTSYETGCAAFSSISHSTTGVLEPYDPEDLLDYCDMIQRELQLLHCLVGGHGLRYNHGWYAGLISGLNWTDGWALLVTGQSDNVVTISYDGNCDPRHLPVGDGTWTALQPGDILASGEYWSAPLGIVVSVAWNANDCTVTMHQSLGLSYSGSTAIMAYGDRQEPPAWFYPIPSVGVQGVCANCRLDRSGKIATVSTWATTANPCYYATGEWGGHHWYCQSMNLLTLAEAQAFAPGVCANTGCAQYVAQAQPWPPLPATFWNAIVAQRDVWQVKVASDWYTRRIPGGIPSLLWLAGAPVYDRGGLVDITVAQPATYSYGAVGILEGADKTFANGVFGRGGTGGKVLQGGTPANKSASGGVSPGETIPAGCTALVDAMDSHPLRLCPSTSNQVYTNQPDTTEGEHTVQRVNRRQRISRAVNMAATAPVSHDGITVTAYPPPVPTEPPDPPAAELSINGFEYRLKIALERTGPFGEKVVIPEAARTIYSATVESNMLRLEFYPGPARCAYVGVDPIQDIPVTYLAGGATVDPPMALRVLTPYDNANRYKTGCVGTDRVTDGDTLVFDNDPTWQFTVTKATAHTGSTFSGTWQGIASTTVPDGPGIPASYESVRLSMDRVWIEWDDSIGKDLITTPAQGHIVTISRQSVLAPKRADTGSWVDAGHDIVLYSRTMGTAEAFATLTQDTDYILDRATGLLYVSAAFCNGTLDGTQCLIVDGWFLEQSNEICAEFLEGIKGCISTLDAIPGGAQIGNLHLMVRDPVMDLLSTSVAVDPHTGACRYYSGTAPPSDNHQLFAEMNNPDVILGNHTYAPTSEFESCGQCVTDYPGSYDGRRCTQSRAYCWTPGSRPFDLGFSGAVPPYAIGGNISGLVSPTFRYLEFLCHLQCMEFGNSYLLSIIPAAWIKAAYVDAQLTNGTTYTQRLEKPSGTLTPTVQQTDGTAGTAHISATAMVVTTIGANVRVAHIGGVGAGASITVTDNDWHTVNVTAAAKAIAGKRLTSNQRMVWLVAGQNAVAEGATFSTLWKSFVNSFSLTGAVTTAPLFDSNLSMKWYYDTAINVSVDHLEYEGLDFQNDRLVLDWDYIRAHPETVPHVVSENMPDLLATFA